MLEEAMEEGLYDAAPEKSTSEPAVNLLPIPLFTKEVNSPPTPLVERLRSIPNDAILHPVPMKRADALIQENQPFSEETHFDFLNWNRQSPKKQGNLASFPPRLMSTSPYKGEKLGIENARQQELARAYTARMDDFMAARFTEADTRLL